MAERRRSPYDLDSLLPPDVEFRLGGRVYRIPADPPVETVALMLQLEERIQTAEERSELVSALREARDLLVELVRERDPSVDTLPIERIGVGGILTVFALISGGPTVADGVVEALTGGLDMDEVSEEEHGSVERKGKGADAGPPSRSARRSSGRSSRLAVATAGRPSTGEP
jgi:hypothetical protein